ncbi:MAG: hypothetical protein GEU86_22605 [Actinophytocola sp.]|nr:hypothetical protein [Actinophytocola sp.]
MHEVDNVYVADASTFPTFPGWYPGEDGYMSDHPMSWTHDKFRGRAFYTALGHESYLYDQDWYRQHLLGGILTAARQSTR